MMTRRLRGCLSTSATIDNPPMYPVLLDNLFPRTGAGAAMTFRQDVTLPNTECPSCTLQVIQFMLGHGPPNYIYYHCADVSIVADPMPDAGVTIADAQPGDVGSSVPDAMTPDATAMTVADATTPDASAVEADAGPGRDAAEMVQDAAAIAAPDAGNRATRSSVGGGCSTGAPELPAVLLLSLGICALWARRRR
jgi:hypothetical protein